MAWTESCRGGRRTPLSLDEALRLVSGGYADPYNNGRLSNARGYITPKDMLAGRPQEIHAERVGNLEVAGKLSAPFQ